MISDRAQACYHKFKENIALAARIEEKLPADIAWSCVVRFYAAAQLAKGGDFPDHTLRVLAVPPPEPDGMN